MQNNHANYTQTLHLTLHLSDLPCVTKCIVYALNYTQTIHKLYTNYTLRRFKPYTKTIHESLQRNYTFCFLNTNQRNQTDESGVTNVTCVTCVTNVTCVTCVTNVTGETKERAKRKDGLVTVSTGRHRGVTEAEFHQHLHSSKTKRSRTAWRRSYKPTRHSYKPFRHFPFKTRCAPSFS